MRAGNGLINCDIEHAPALPRKLSFLQVALRCQNEFLAFDYNHLNRGNVSIDCHLCIGNHFSVIDALNFDYFLKLEKVSGKVTAGSRAGAVSLCRE